MGRIANSEWRIGFYGLFPLFAIRYSLRAIRPVPLFATARPLYNPTMQSENPILDGLAKMFTDAAGAAQGVRAEVDTFMKQRLERLVADMDFVPREEFEAVKAMAAKAREENAKLEARIAELESKTRVKSDS